MGYSLEVDMIREAKKLGLLTTPYAHNVDEAKAMAEAGADIVVGVCVLTPLPASIETTQFSCSPHGSHD